MKWLCRHLHQGHIWYLTSSFTPDFHVQKWRNDKRVSSTRIWQNPRMQNKYNLVQINKGTTIVREFSIGRIFCPLNFRVAFFSLLWPLDHKALLRWVRLRVYAAIVRLTQVSVALGALAGTASSTHRSCWFLFGGRVKPTSLFHR